MTEVERIERFRDLVGSFSLFLDEFAACWGGLRIANDQLRSAWVSELLDSVAPRSAMSDWIEQRLDDEHADLVLPVVSLLWAAEGVGPGALHSFEVHLDATAPVGAERLAGALTQAAEAHGTHHLVGARAASGAAAARLAATAAAQHRFGLPAELFEQLDRATGEIRLAALLRSWRPADGELRDADARVLRALAGPHGWGRRAIEAHAELVALPGIQLRRYSLEPTLPPELMVLAGLVRDGDDLSSFKSRVGPALVTAWDSLSHTFGDEGPVHDPIEAPDDEFRDWDEDWSGVGAEASILHAEGVWFAGLLGDEAGVPRLSGAVRSLLAARPSGAGVVHARDAHVALLLDDAGSTLARMASNLGADDRGPYRSLTDKASRLATVSDSDADRDTAAYVVRVADGLTAAAGEAAAFAEHLDAGADEVGDLDLGLRLAAILAWLDSVARWIVSDATVERGDGRGGRPATPPVGHRSPEDLLDEMIAALPDQLSTEEFGLVLEQREAQWDELATLDDSGPLELSDDCSDVVDIEGFANR